MKTMSCLFGVLLLSPCLVLGQFAYWPPANGGNGHYYEAVVSQGISWFQASAAATNKGGYLATIASAQENAFVFELIRTNFALWHVWNSTASYGPWLGGYQPAGSAEPAGGWSWVTGEPFVYTNWKVGEPHNGGVSRDEDRLQFWGGGSQAPAGDLWNDINGSDTGVYGFVMEYDRHPNAALVQIGLKSTNEVELSWQSRANVRYTVQWTTALPGAGWGDLTTVSGNGGTNYASDAVVGARKFYRVVSTP